MIDQWEAGRLPGYKVGRAVRFAPDSSAPVSVPVGHDHEKGELSMAGDLAYDMMLEVQGLIRSFGIRTSLDRELRIGETFTMKGRSWVVTNVHATGSEGIDRRVVARELEEPVTV